MKMNRQSNKITFANLQNKGTRLFLFISCLFFCFTTEIMAQNGETVFKQNCAACHTVGKGRLVGPDLAGITTKRPEEWLLKWTKSSQALVKSGDADAKAIFDEYNGMIMPDQSQISDADIKSIYAFISSKGVAAPETATASTVASNASDNASVEDIETGKQIFLGSVALTNGGPSCISCHHVNYKGIIPGGLLAKDLTTAYSRLGGDAGLQGILGAPPFPAMTQSYKDRPITEKEIADLTAFLNKVDKENATAPQVSKFNPLLYGGVGGVGVLFVLIFVLWHVRKKVTVKKDIYNRQIKSI